ncbi:MAG: GNAT family N-acetyltransferase [Melioribacteraceae bacterium]|nr:GNAT family N-acetyltransferase [Melioribacteraceae bacterium]
MNLETEFEKENYVISLDKSRLDINVIHKFLINSYWAKNIPLDTVKRGIENSVCFGVYHSGNQIGFARVITDYVSLGYIADVFIIEEYRGKGLSKWLMEVIMNYPGFKDLRGWGLKTADAHGLYKKFGFTELKDPGKSMELAKFTSYK